MAKSIITPEQLGQFWKDKEKLPSAVRTAITKSISFDPDTHFLVYDLRVGAAYLDEQQKKIQDDIELLWGPERKVTK